MKILMTTMSLDIGGAETHIIELSRELKRRGVDVTVASNGGVYVPQLEEAGIKHVKIPLHTKKPQAVLRSMLMLRKLIKREKYDIVHAHARIPAFICGLLSRSMKFRFVTTTHGVYDAPLYWRLLSKWGEHSLAVSYDVKQYLIDNYNIPSDNITITINGIDTNRYSTQNASQDLIRELSLARDCRHRVLYVSRIDREAAHIGFQLVEAAPMLCAVYDDIEFVLVGGGTAFADLKARADEMNRMLGRKVITLTGSRTDVWRFMSLADIFVGVSRSALEAMACELPTIISGSQGYIGVFTPEKLRDALDTNFCARGCGDSNAKLMYDDIVKLFSMSDSERKELGRYNRRIVLERYSIGRMAEDALSVYNRMRPFEHYRHGDVIISGYYGFGNMGDDSLLQLIIGSLKKRDPEMKITVLSRDPKKTRETYGVRSINRFDIPAIIREMKSKSCRLLISGGGTLLTDITSERSLFYYTYIMKLAKKHGLDIMMYASGIGPLQSDRSRRMAKQALEDADVITLRDNMSHSELEALGIDKAKAVVTADPAFRLQPQSDNWIKYVMNREGLSGDRKYFAVSVRGGVTGISAGELEKLAFACRLVCENTKLTPVIVVLQPLLDDEVSKKLAELISTGGKGRRIDIPIVDGLCASELTGLMTHMEFAISMRLHLLIYSCDAGIPVAALSHDPKLDALCEMLGIGDCLVNMDGGDMTSDMLIKTLMKLYNERDELRSRIAAKTAELSKLAANDAELAFELLEKRRRNGK